MDRTITPGFYKHTNNIRVFSAENRCQQHTCTQRRRWAARPRTGSWGSPSGRPGKPGENNHTYIYIYIQRERESVVYSNNVSTTTTTTTTTTTNNNDDNNDGFPSQLQHPVSPAELPPRRARGVASLHMPNLPTKIIPTKIC